MFESTRYRILVYSKNLQIRNLTNPSILSSKPACLSNTGTVSTCQCLFVIMIRAELWFAVHVYFLFVELLICFCWSVHAIVDVLLVLLLSIVSWSFTPTSLFFLYYVLYFMFHILICLLIYHVRIFIFYLIRLLLFCI